MPLLSGQPHGVTGHENGTPHRLRPCPASPHATDLAVRIAAGQGPGTQDQRWSRQWVLGHPGSIGQPTVGERRCLRSVDRIRTSEQRPGPVVRPGRPVGRHQPFISPNTPMRHCSGCRHLSPLQREHRAQLQSNSERVRSGSNTPADELNDTVTEGTDIYTWLADPHDRSVDRHHRSPSGCVLGSAAARPGRPRLAPGAAGLRRCSGRAATPPLPSIVRPLRPSVRGRPSPPLLTCWPRVIRPRT